MCINQNNNINIIGNAIEFYFDFFFFLYSILLIDHDQRV